MRWESVGEIRNEYKIFIGKPEGKLPLGRPKRKLGDGPNIKTDLNRL
jgi:hypothetical protein